MKNIEAFKTLAKKYQEVTILEIKEKWTDCGKTTANRITGFGTVQDCSLCREIQKESIVDCALCVWYYLEWPTIEPCSTHYTYKQIRNAMNYGQLYESFQARGRYMEKRLQELHIKTQ